MTATQTPSAPAPPVARRPKRRGPLVVLCLLALLACGVCAARLAATGTVVDAVEAFRAAETSGNAFEEYTDRFGTALATIFTWPDDDDIWRVRIDRVLIGVAVGAALAVSGALLQALLRNPLASPYVLGISTGAALGVMMSWAGWLAFIGPLDDAAAAAGGALITLFVVYLLGQRRGRIDPLGLLLVGVIVNAIGGAAIMFIQYATPHGLRADMAVWMLGYLNMDVPREPTIYFILTVIGVGTALGVLLGRAMDVASFSDDEAYGLGVSLGWLRLVLFVIAGLMTAGAVTLAGPIGFVGLIAPHLVRLMIGPGHSALVLGSALAGVVLVVGADTAIRILDVGQGMMPLGVITALIGGPVFLMLLRPQLGRGVAP